MPATVDGIHLSGDHASRPAANAAGLPVGSLYACSDHALIYKTDGAAWSTWATLGAAISDIVNLPTAETDTDLVLSPDGAGGVLFRAESGAGGGGVQDSGTLVQSFAWANITADPQVKTMPANPTDGNVLVAAIVTNQHAVTSLTQTGVTWSLVAKGHNPNGNIGICELWLGEVGPGADDDITIDLAGHNAEAIIVQEWSGLTDADMKQSLLVQSSSTAITRLHFHTFHWDNPGGRLFVLVQSSTGGALATPAGLTASTGTPFNYGGAGYGALYTLDAEASSAKSLATRFVPPGVDNYTVCAIHLKP